MDLGVSCLHEHWVEQYGESDFVVALENYLVKGFDKVLKNCSHKGFKAKTNKRPYLNGNWGDCDIATMTEQAVVLGIPSIQLEIPLSMRALLFRDATLSN